MPRAIASLLTSLALLAPVAQAQSPANMLAEVGMLGTWAADCSRPPLGGNPHTVFELGPDGVAAQYRVLFDAGNSTTRSIDSVRMLGPDTVAMRLTTLTGTSTGLAFDITMLKETARYKVIGSVGSDGKVYIKDGMVVATGAPNPWQNKCRN